jgi:undecaprenyl diphosphate synthase
MKVLINSLKKITHTSKNNIKLNAIGNLEDYKMQELLDVIDKTKNNTQMTLT